MQKERFQFIEGLRGIAALIVVLAHCCSTFYPFFARVGQNQKSPWESTLAHSPAFTLVDGTDAVVLFFLMSGFVLAGAYLTSNLPTHILMWNRLKRLSIPVIASMIFCGAIYAAFPPLMHQISSASPWAEKFWPRDASRFVYDLLFGSLLVGYKGLSVFDNIPFLSLPKLMGAFNLPTWSLHIELWGSFMVIGIAFFMRRSRYGLLLVLLGLILLNALYTAFLVGFLFYIYRSNLIKSGVFWDILGWLCICAGVSLTYQSWGTPVDEIQAAVAWFQGIGLPASWRAQGLIATSLIFLGGLLSCRSRRFLSMAIFQTLGRLSFSLYLLHFPILVTIGARVYIAMGEDDAAAAAATVVTIGISFGAAILMEKYVDRAAIRWSKSAPREGISSPGIPS